MPYLLLGMLTVLTGQCQGVAVATFPETLLKWRGSGPTLHGTFFSSAFILCHPYGKSDKQTKHLLSWSMCNQLMYFFFFFFLTQAWLTVRSGILEQMKHQQASLTTCFGLKGFRLSKLGRGHVPHGLMFHMVYAQCGLA